MIRTTLSFCALFASLLLVSKWLYQSSPPQARPASSHDQPAVEPQPAALSSPAAAPAQPAVSTQQSQPVVRLLSFEDDRLAEVVDSGKAAKPATKPGISGHIEDESVSE